MKFTKFTKWILSSFTGGLIIIACNYEIVSVTTRDLIFKEMSDVPQRDICLILGTPKYLKDGTVNNYYHNRILSAAGLYNNHKVMKVIISADTLNKYCENEVELIKNDLLQYGIHESDLIFDNSGDRTWDSILNLKKTGKNKFIFVSQTFHLQRALYLTHRIKLDAIGYSSEGKPSVMLIIREALARIKMQIDLVLN